MSRILASLAALAATVLGTVPAHAFPDRPISIIVPWAAGGGSDTVTRLFVNGFQKELGVGVNVVNRAGGNGVAGHSAIATASPDGYTLGIASPEIAFYQTMGVADISVDDLDLFSRLGVIPAGITVAADSPYQDLQGVIDAIKNEPEGTLTASGTGMGGSWHVAAAGMLMAADIDPTKLRWVPSQGGAPALIEVTSGSISLFTGSPVEAESLLEAGRVRTLAIMTEERSAEFPDVPTLKEAADIDWAYSNFFGLVAPKGLDPAIRQQILEAAERAMQDPAVQKSLSDRGITPVWDAPGEFETYAKAFSATARNVLEGLKLASQ